MTRSAHHGRRTGRHELLTKYEPYLIWVAYLVVHLTVVLQGLANRGVIADVELYDWWVRTGFTDGTWPVITGGWQYSQWVYPLLALVPMVLAFLLSPLLGVPLAWLVLACLASAGALGALRRYGSRLGSWWWLAYIACLGPISMSRLDIFVAVAICLALCFWRRSPLLSGALLAGGAWVKIVPGLVLWPLLVAHRKRARRVVLGAVAVTAGVVLAAGSAGALPRVLSFATAQHDRGLQVESVAASVAQMGHIFGLQGVVEYNDEIATFEITGATSQVIAHVSSVLFYVVMLVIVALVWRARHAGMDVAVWGALAFLAWAIIANKVGSPQFQMWLLAPIAVGLARHAMRNRWRLIAAIGLISAVLTQLVYPWLYGALLSLDMWAIGVLAVRNCLVVVIGCLALWSLWQAKDLHANSSAASSGARLMSDTNL